MKPLRTTSSLELLLLIDYGLKHPLPRKSRKTLIKTFYYKDVRKTCQTRKKSDKIREIYTF